MRLPSDKELLPFLKDTDGVCKNCPQTKVSVGPKTFMDAFPGAQEAFKAVLEKGELTINRAKIWDLTLKRLIEFATTMEPNEKTIATSSQNSPVYTATVTPRPKKKGPPEIITIPSSPQSPPRKRVSPPKIRRLSTSGESHTTPTGHTSSDPFLTKTQEDYWSAKSDIRVLDEWVPPHANPNPTRERSTTRRRKQRREPSIFLTGTSTSPSDEDHINYDFRQCIDRLIKQRECKQCGKVHRDGDACPAISQTCNAGATSKKSAQTSKTDYST